jgi:uncharacterized Zn ribbon protein
MRPRGCGASFKFEESDIDCKIDGIGQMGLKSEFVKRA